MNFASFLSFVQLYASGKLGDEQTYKHYDLLWRANDRRLRRALRECGFTYRELYLSVAECAARIRDRGLHFDESAVRRLLLEWYVWRGLKTGEYRKWKYREHRAK